MAHLRGKAYLIIETHGHGSTAIWHDDELFIFVGRQVSGKVLKRYQGGLRDEPSRCAGSLRQKALNQNQMADLALARKRPFAAQQIHFAGATNVLAGGALVERIEARCWSNSLSLLTTSPTSKSARIGGRPGRERAVPIWSRLLR